MIRMVLEGLLARKVRLVTTALAVTLGVAFIAGTLVLTNTITKTFNDLFANVYQGTDAVVRGAAAFNGPLFTGEQRSLVDASLVPVLSRVPGVAAADGNVSGYTRLVGKNGKALGNPAMGAPTLGGNWITSPQLNQFRLVAGHAPRAANEVVIDKKSATDGKLSVGDTTIVLVQGPPLPVRISGIATFGTADSPAGASVVLFTTPVAQRLVARPGMFTEIHFVARAGVSQEQLVSNLRRALPPGTEAVTGAAVTKDAQDSIKQFTDFIGTFMLIFALVALLVGAFMIFNTFSITVAQRTRENGLLRALGASRRQVLASVLIEAVVVGLIASLIGLAAGVAVAIGLKALVGAVVGIPASGIVFAASTVVIALVAGITVTIVAAISPARKAAKVPPVAAMQEVAAGSTGYGSKERVMVGTGILVAGVAALFIGLFAHVSHKFQIVGAGALLVFFGVSVLGRTISLPLSRLIGTPLPRLRGVTGGLARENAMRNPKRTAASASALMIGVGVVCFITIFASSSRASINASVDRTFAGDIVVDSGTGVSGGGLDESLPQALNTLPHVASATGKSVGLVKIFGTVEQIAAVDPGTASEIFDVKAQQGSIRDLGVSDIAIYSGVARSHHLKLGSTVPVLFKDTGLQRLRVALIYGDNEAAPSAAAGTKASYFLGSPAYDANFASRYYGQVIVKKAPGVSAAAALAAVKTVAAQYPGTTVLDRSGYKKLQTNGINRTLTLVYALLGLAIIIALLGIGNTLALSIFERTRELGVLRAIGMTRRQLRSTIRWESVILALQGTVLGLLIGVFFGWVLVLALHDQGITVFSLPVLTLAVVFVLAGLAGVVAAILPSRRAAKLNILRAVVSE